MPRAPKIRFIVLCSIAAGFTLMISSFFSQIANTVSVQNAALRIEQERNAHGAYPKSIPSSIHGRDELGRDLRLIEDASNDNAARCANLGPVHARDTWGRELLYITDGTGFVLVSFGLGGKPDMDDYTTMIAYQQSNGSNNCFWPWSDTVFTNNGPVSYCLK